MMDQLRVGTAKSYETSENEKGPKCCSRTILIRECGKLCKITFFALFCSVIDIENLLNHLESFSHCHLYLLLQPVFFPLSSQQPLVFSSAFVGCYDYFSFGFTALNQSALNLIFLKLCPL